MTRRRRRKKTRGSIRKTFGTIGRPSEERINRLLPNALWPHAGCGSVWPCCTWPTHRRAHPVSINFLVFGTTVEDTIALRLESHETIPTDCETACSPRSGDDIFPHVACIPPISHALPTTSECTRCSFSFLKMFFEKEKSCRLSRYLDPSIPRSKDVRLCHSLAHSENVSSAQVF